MVIVQRGGVETINPDRPEVSGVAVPSEAFLQNGEMVCFERGADVAWAEISGPGPAPMPSPIAGGAPKPPPLHRIVREHLETYLALANESDPIGAGVPGQMEKELRGYLKSDILAGGCAGSNTRPNTPSEPAVADRFRHALLRR